MTGMVFRNEMWDLMRTVTECMDKAFMPIVYSYGLTAMQTRILVEIKDNGHHTVGSLGKVFSLTSGNASSMCKKLEKSGFIKRIRNNEDERFVKLALTDFGNETLENIKTVIDKKYGIFLSEKEEEFEEIFKEMKNLAAIIKEMCDIN